MSRYERAHLFVFGIVTMYALVALGLVAGLFALLNLIEYRRLD
jgi:hypothetical protein